MNKERQEIECLTRLNSLSGSVEDILEFLLSEALITKDDVRAVKLSPEMPKVVHRLLTSLSATGKVQLMEYEWSILPVERIKVLFVTDRNSREFTYNF